MNIRLWGMYFFILWVKSHAVNGAVGLLEATSHTCPSSSALRPWAASWPRHVTKARRPRMTCFTRRTCGLAEISTGPCDRSGRATPSRGSTSLRPYKTPPGRAALSHLPFLNGHHLSLLTPRLTHTNTWWYKAQYTHSTSQRIHNTHPFQIYSKLEQYQHGDRRALPLTKRQTPVTSLSGSMQGLANPLTKNLVPKPSFLVFQILFVYLIVCNLIGSDQIIVYNQRCDK